ncbi:MAG: hypothetical protein R3297_07830, partial [Desulfobulbales bacterium]|nr:hypothetical protein [Desulfobulbales bacterium]
MAHPLAHIIAQCFVNIPFADFAKYERFVSQYRINPELGLDGEVLYDAGKQAFIDRARFLHDEGLTCTIHAPFHDILPGARDKYILKASREKLRRCFDLIETFR